LKNLEKLREFVENIEPSMINMDTWRAESDIEESPVCSSVGCIIGHATGMMTEEEFNSILDSKDKIVFMNVSEMLFDINYYPNKSVWDFLFSTDWIEAKGDQKENFLGRLDYVIKHGKTPEDYDYMDTKFE
jgi:hypothetical protein